MLRKIEILKDANILSPIFDDNDCEEVDLTLCDEPTKLRQAQQSSDWEKWQNAMNEEIDALSQNKTWELVDKPEKQKN